MILQKGVSEELYNKTLNDILADPNNFNLIRDAGYSIGEKGVPRQRLEGYPQGVPTLNELNNFRGYAGGVNAKHIWATNPELVKQTFPNKK
jgi:hypothetical protein